MLFESVEREEGKFVARGGRALAIAAKGRDLDDACVHVEYAAEGIGGNLRMRQDIGILGRRKRRG